MLALRICQKIKVEQEDIAVLAVHIKKDILPERQAGTVRHKSPHAAYALGYLTGIEDSYR